MDLGHDGRKFQTNALEQMGLGGGGGALVLPRMNLGLKEGSGSEE